MDGSWEDNKKHGAMTFICSNGRAVQLQFEHDTLVNSDAIGLQQRSQLWLNYPDLHEGNAFQQQQVVSAGNAHQGTLADPCLAVGERDPSSSFGAPSCLRQVLSSWLCKQRIQRLQPDQNAGSRPGVVEAM